MPPLITAVPSDPTPRGAAVAALVLAVPCAVIAAWFGSWPLVAAAGGTAAVAALALWRGEPEPTSAVQATIDSSKRRLVAARLDAALELQRVMEGAYASPEAERLEACDRLLEMTADPNTKARHRAFAIFAACADAVPSSRREAVSTRFHELAASSDPQVSGEARAVLKQLEFWFAGRPRTK